MLFTENNIKNFYISRKGNFRKINGKIHYYHYACDVCGYPYLHQTKNGKFCGYACANTGENNIWFGKKNPMHSLRMIGELNPMFGKNGELNPMYKGDDGITINNIPLYDTYAHQLEPIEKCMRDPEDPNILNVFCTYSGCKNRFRPKASDVRNRIIGINKNDIHRFYCSDHCKQVCPLFNQSAESLMRIDAINANRIEKLNQHDLRINQKANKNHRYKVNGGICDGCGIKVSLHTSILHHENPVSDNFLMADDPDNHWLFCKACDKKAHQLLSCNYYELRLRRVCKT
jgi:hypothetical protein